MFTSAAVPPLFESGPAAAAMALGSLLAALCLIWVLLRRKKVPAMPADYHELRPSTPLLISSVAFYIFLVCRAVTLDLLDSLAEALPWRKRKAVARDPDRRGPPLKSGLQDLYERRMYGRISDTFNRPITGEAGGEVTVLARAWSRETGELELTGEEIRCLNLGSYNYLGFGGCDEICTPTVLKSVAEHGSSTSSTRAECGTMSLHVQFEKTVAAFVGKEAAITMGMGFATNATMIPTIVDAEGNGSGVLVLSDALNHSSIIEGVRASGACVVPFVHNSMIDLEAKLRAARANGQPRTGVPWRKMIVIVEGIYSMEGEFCRLRETVALKKAYGAYLYLDEAHSIGAVGPSGRGVAELLGVPTSEIDIMMGTFTKSFGSVGGYVASDAATIETLRARSQGSLCATAMSPPAVQQVLSSLRVILSAAAEEGRLDEATAAVCDLSSVAGSRAGSTAGGSVKDGGLAVSPAAARLGAGKIKALKENALFFRRALMDMGCEVLGDEGSPVVPIMIYHPEKMALFSRELLARKIAVVVVGYPATPLLLSRARFCVSAAHTRPQLEYALECIREVSKKLDMFYCARPAARAAAEERNAKRVHLLHNAPLSMPNAKDVAASLPAWTPEPLCGVPAAQGSPRSPAAAAVANPCPSGASRAFAAVDPLALARHPALIAAAVSAVKGYGVGTCGPRAFYGTLDLHLRLEAQLARFLGTERSIVYSKGVATLSSVIPAFAKRTDAIFLDSGAHTNARVRAGCELSRAHVRVYPRGDVAALRALLADQDAADKRLPAKKVGRRFIITEGICAATGDVAPLPDLLDVRDAFGCYLFVDETHSMGVLGNKGRGVAEHFGLEPSVIDAIIGSLEHALGSVGGFCAGSQQIVRQQRLFATGYIFSASLPAYCCAAASAAVATLEAEPERAARARDVTAAIRSELDASGVGDRCGVVVTGGAGALLHVRAPCASSDPLAQRAALVRVASRVLSASKVVLSVLPAEAGVDEHDAAAVARWRAAPLPSLRITPTCALSLKEAAAAGRELATALISELPPLDRDSTVAAKARQLRSNGAAAVGSEPVPALTAASAPMPRAAASSSSDDADSEEDVSAIDASSGSAAPEGANRPRAPLRGPKATVPPPAPEVVSTPVGLALSALRRALHNYLRRQSEWGMTSVVPRLQKQFRSTTSKRLFYGMSLLGSEPFYVTCFPALIWAEARSVAADAAGTSLAHTLVLFFAASVVVGNWAKVAVALPRPARAARGGQVPPADEGWNRDFAWPSITAMNAVGLPFFVLRYHFSSTWLWNQTSPHQAVGLYALAFLWAAGICGSRLVAGAASPADVQGGMLIGALLVRLSMPHHEQLLAWLLSPEATVLGLTPEVALPAAAALLLLLHPVSPRDERGTYSVLTSAKALSFAATFALSTRARALTWAVSPSVAFPVASPASAAVCAYHGFAGLALMATLIAATHSPRRMAVRSAKNLLGFVGKVLACSVEYAVLGFLVAHGVPLALDEAAKLAVELPTLIYA